MISSLCRLRRELARVGKSLHRNSLGSCPEVRARCEAGFAPGRVNELRNGATEGKRVLPAPQFPSRIAIACGDIGAWRERPFYMFLTLHRLDTGKTQSCVMPAGNTVLADRPYDLEWDPPVGPKMSS